MPPSPRNPPTATAAPAEDAMSQSAGLGVATITRELTVESWNGWLAAATGLSEDAARGRSILSLVPEARVDAIRAVFEEVLTTGTTRVLAPAFHRCLIACPPSMPSRHFSQMQQFVTIAPLMSGTRSGAMITIEDVTERLERQHDLIVEIESAGTVPPGALEAVGAGDWRLRGAAVRALRAQASADEIATLLDVLQRGYQDLNVVGSALQVLTSANRDVTTPLIELLSRPEPDLRMHAALALGKVGDRAAVPALVGLLRDPDVNVTFHALEALGELGAGDAVDAIAAVARAGDFFLAFPAIAALAKTDDPRVAPALASLLENEMLRPAVIETLGELGDEDSVAPLLAVLNTDASSAAAIADALGRIRLRYEATFGAGAQIVDLVRRAITPRGVATLAAAVNAREAPLASLVAALGWVGPPALPALLAVLGNSDAAGAVTAAVAAIGREAAGPLIDILTTGDRAARLAAVSLLGTIG